MRSDLPARSACCCAPQLLCKRKPSLGQSRNRDTRPSCPGHLDMTPFRSPNPRYASVTGDGDAFLRAIYEEVQPFVLSHLRVDPNRQAIWGHSIGGLLVLRSMFRAPGRFSTYLMASPTVNPNVLADEPAFFERIARTHMVLRVLITVGGDEQPPGAAMAYKTVDDASNLADRLRAGAPQLEVECTIFSAEV